MKTIPTEALEVLNKSTIIGLRLYLPHALPRDLYEKVAKVIKDHGGKWDRKNDCHLFSEDVREKLGIALKTGKSVSLQQERQSFFTPPEIAERLCEDIKEGEFILEPSAGEGAIVREILKKKATVLAIEKESVYVRKLEKLVALTDSMVVHGDFLKFQKGANDGAYDPLSLTLCQFDRVIMNPPFTRGQDAKHIIHAYQFVRQGGILKSIISPHLLKKNKQIKQLFDDTGTFIPPAAEILCQLGDNHRYGHTLLVATAMMKGSPRSLRIPRNGQEAMSALSTPSSATTAALQSMLRRPIHSPHLPKRMRLLRQP